LSDSVVRILIGLGGELGGEGGGGVG